MAQNKIMAGKQPSVRHSEQFDPHANKWQVQNDQHGIANPHRGNQTPKQLWVAGHHLRARLNVVNGHGTDHQGHHGIGWNTQGEQWNEGGL